MRNLLDGGEHLTQLKDDVMKQMEANPIFQNHDAHDLNVDQERERTMKNVNNQTKRRKENVSHYYFKFYIYIFFSYLDFMFCKLVW